MSRPPPLELCILVAPDGHLRPKSDARHRAGLLLRMDHERRVRGRGHRFGTNK